MVLHVQTAARWEKSNWGYAKKPKPNESAFTPEAIEYLKYTVHKLQGPLKTSAWFIKLV